jgi:DNA-directed RNA polymerase specialized sigma24 family protein
MNAVDAAHQVDCYTTFIAGICRRYARRCPSLHDDLFQDAAMMVYRAALKLPEPFGAGLTATITRRACWTRLKLEMKQNPVFEHEALPIVVDGERIDPLAFLADDSPPIGTTLEAADLIALAREFGQPLDWDLLTRYVADDCTLDELAASLGVSRTRIQQRLDRIKKQAREAIGQT